MKRSISPRRSLRLPLFGAVVAVVVCIVLVGCDSNRPNSTEEPPQPPMLATQAQCEDVARAVDSLIRRQDTAALADLFDEAIFTKRVLYNVGLGRADMDSVQQLVRVVLSRVVMSWINANGNGSSFRYLRVNWNHGNPRAVFRLVGFGGEFEYVDLILCTNVDGSVRVCDQYAHYSGGLISSMCRRIVRSDAPGIAEQLLPDALTKRPKRWVDTLRSRFLHDEPVEVLRYYDSVPADQRDAWEVQSLRLRAAASLGDSLYQPVIAHAYSVFKEKPGYELLALRYFMTYGQHGNALAAVERVETAVGGDPYLNVTRGWIHALQHDNEAGQTYVQRYIAADSSVTFPFCLLFEIYLRAKQYGPATDCFAVLSRRAGPDNMEHWLDGSEFAAAYRASPAYRAYRQSGS